MPFADVTLSLGLAYTFQTNNLRTPNWTITTDLTQTKRIQH